MNSMIAATLIRSAREVSSLSPQAALRQALAYQLIDTAHVISNQRGTVLYR